MIGAGVTSALRILEAAISCACDHDATARARKPLVSGGHSMSRLLCTMRSSLKAGMMAPICPLVDPAARDSQDGACSADAFAAAA